MAYGKPPVDLVVSNAKRPPEEETAYQEWVRLPNKYQKGGIATVSKRLGIDIKKVSDWHHRYQWRKRWVSEIVGASGAIIEEAAAILVSTYPAASDRLSRIIHEGNDRDAIFAIRAMKELASTIAPEAHQSNTYNIIDKQLVVDAKAMTRDELFSAAQEVSQANIDRALASRVSKRQAVPTSRCRGSLLGIVYMTGCHVSFH